MLTSIRHDQAPPTDPRRGSQWLWTLLHAQALLAGPAGGAADGAGSAGPAEDDYPRLTAARGGGYQARVP